jgi:hypothetical protein
MQSVAETGGRILFTCSKDQTKEKMSQKHMFYYAWFLHCDHINPLNAELNPICHLLAFAAAPYIYDISRLRVNMYKNFKISDMHTNCSRVIGFLLSFLNS